MTERAIFGGGCFWCTEAVFKSLKGVTKVLPGYARSTSSGQAGEIVTHPTYEEVASGKTGYAEVVSVEYDPVRISYKTLLTIFFASHDPTTVNRQGNDVGTQYRSVIFYTSLEQRKEAEEFIKDINMASNEGASVVTEVEPLDNPARGGASFYEAEDYHKNYFEKNKSAPYCQLVINPKLEKVQKEFAELVVGSKQ